MVLFHSISGQTAADKSVQNFYWVCMPGPWFREYALKNLLLKSSVISEICLIMLLFNNISGHTASNKSAKTYIGVCIPGPQFTGLCPKKFSFISLVISEKCLIRLLFHSTSGHTAANKSAQNLYWVCILAHNSGNMPWKILFYIYIHFWDMPHFATFS